MSQCKCDVTIYHANIRIARIIDVLLPTNLLKEISVYILGYTSKIHGKFEKFKFYFSFVVHLGISNYKTKYA